ncbi:MAG: glycosyltransferase 87 family protein [Solirubrobacteraceae bacterium]
MRGLPLPGRPAAIALFIASVAAFLASPLAWGWSFIDLEVYRGGGQALLDGAPLYRLIFHGFLHFTYPPFAAMVFTPLAALPNTVLKPIITIVNIALLPVILRVALRLPPVSTWLSGEQATRLALIGAAAAVWLEPVWSTLGYGQINLLIVALVVGDLAQRDESRWKGVGIGLACGLKLTPGIFTVYLLLTRRYRAAAVSLGTFAATLAAGFAVAPRDAADFWGGAFLDPSRVGRIENAANQTLRGAFARLLHSLNVEAWWMATALLVGALGMLLAVRAGRRGDEACGFSICALTGLLVSPISWSHHWTLAVPVLLLFVVRAHRGRHWFALAAGGAVAVIGYSQVVHWVPRPSAASLHVELHLDAPQLVAADAYVLLALGALVIGSVFALRERRPPI